MFYCTVLVLFLKTPSSLSFSQGESDEIIEYLPDWLGLILGDFQGFVDKIFKAIKKIDSGWTGKAKRYDINIREPKRENKFKLNPYQQINLW